MADVDVEKGYALLSIGGAESANHMTTRPVGSKGLLLALAPDGSKHLLTPTSAAIKEDVQSRGVHLRNQPLVHQGRERLYADLACLEPALDMVFDRLVQDVVTHAEAHNHDPLISVREVLGQWRELLRRGNELTADTVIGLVGELHVLRQLAAVDPAGALDAWTGPRRTVHDFVRGEHALEVKTVATLEGNSVSINGLDQLDPAEVATLHLTVVHCRESETAPSLDDRIRDLVDVGVPSAPLLAAVAQAGYVFESRVPIPTTYRIASTRYWLVGPTFPGLRRSALPEGMRRGVTRVQYTLSVDSAPTPLPKTYAEEFPKRWMSDV